MRNWWGNWFERMFGWMKVAVMSCDELVVMLVRDYVSNCSIANESISMRSSSLDTVAE